MLGGDYMIISKFEARGKCYQFKYILNFWAEREFILIEDNQEVGVLNVNYTVEEGEQIVKSNRNFQQTGAIIS